jgi:hypothetical protein
MEVPQHYAFLVSDGEFAAAFAGIRKAGVTYYADPHMKQPGEINHHDGGSGVYFLDPAGHGMDLITRPYGSGERPDGHRAVGCGVTGIRRSATT